MPKDRKFVNPLTQPSEIMTQPSTSSATLPATETTTLPSTYTYTYTSLKSAHRKRGSQAFEKTHERVTYWLDRGLKQQFEALADEQGTAKSGLLDEAIADLLAKYHPTIALAIEQKPPVPLAVQASPKPEIRKPAEVEAQPVIISLVTFADQHFVSRNDAERLWKRGMITGVRQVGKGVMLYQKGLHDFWVQFHETPGFRTCDDCPHTQQGDKRL